MIEHPGFVDIGKGILQAWQGGIEGLRDRRTYALSGVDLGDAFSGFSDIKPVKTEKKVIGRSELLGGRK